ncbi:hypothetical protein HY635_03535 [Candidatus Uhrbacteria bacterium]|nr:hypothetical protein [Candidatus Uhrbacteria bacterium]
MDQNGRVFRDGDHTIVEVPWANGHHALDQPGVEVTNPDAPEADRIIRKVFTRKRTLYLPDELDRAREAHVAHPDNLVLSMNGYSQITAEQCQRYGIQPGGYEAACAALLRRTITHLRQRFPAAQLRIISGASALGVDLAINAVAREFNITPLGFSCPEFMLWVDDDELPVYVAASKDEYADRYIQTLDLLIATGGREHALQHDVLSACIYGKRIHFVDVLSMLSSTGTVPATIVDVRGRVRVENAAAAMGRYVSFFSVRKAPAQTPAGGDVWDALFDDVASVATEVCRGKLSPDRKFG